MGVTPKWPEFELVPDFMSVLFTCKLEEDQIKSEGDNVETYF